MVILHVAHIKNDLFSGVGVVVPQHVRAQSEVAQVGFLNVSGEEIKNVENQIAFQKGILISELPEPFCSPDLIVFHEVYYPAFLGLYKQAKRLGVPYVIVPHGCLTHSAQRKKRVKKLAGNILLFNRFIRGAVGIQYLSADERDSSAFGKKKFIGTNGMLIPALKKELFSETGTKFLYIGRLDTYHKGLDMMMEAAGMTLIEKPGEIIEFILCGPNREGQLEVLQGLVERFSVNEIVELNGPVVGGEKERTLLDSDIFIQTSRFEGMPMGILEALSYGIPCLVTRGTNLGELIETYDAGWVAETDAQSIAEAIVRAVGDRGLWEEKSENARRLIEENFLWDKVAEETVAEYRRIIGK